MPKVTLQIKGLKKFTRTLAKYPQIVGKNFSRAIELAFNELARETAPKTPIDTGRLRRDAVIFGLVKPKISKLSGISRDLTRLVEYAGHVHLRKPYLKKGMKAAEKKIKQRFEDAIEQTHKDIIRKSK